MAGAIAFLAFQTVSLSNRVSSLQHSSGTQAQLAAHSGQIKELQGQVTTLRGDLATNSATLAAMADLTQPKSFASQLHTIYNCTPQMETQINGINISGGAFPYIQNDVQISRDCSTLIYGPQTTTTP